MVADTKVCKGAVVQLLILTTDDWHFIGYVGSLYKAFDLIIRLNFVILFQISVSRLHC